jgi:ADP-ribosyl-[dinitrogen reductase] hydrolase
MEDKSRENTNLKRILKLDNEEPRRDLIDKLKYFSGMSKENFDEFSFDEDNGSYNKDGFDFEKLKKEENYNKLEKAVSSFICSALGDAFGVHTEFVEYNKMKEIKGIKDVKGLKEFIKKGRNRERCKFGEFSDDTSMALCLADSLFYNNGKLNPIDLRIRFLFWWHLGYNNCRDNEKSFGLGGNINESFNEFRGSNFGSEYFISQDGQQTNGNGSLMRNAAVPIMFHNNIEEALKIAEGQSKTTHSGTEAAQCCQVLTYLIIKNINDDSKLSAKKKLKIHMKELEEEKNLKFCHSVNKLITSDKDTKTEYENNKKDYHPIFNKDENDRNWNWKDPSYIYSPTRNNLLPGYIGSYCMDALAMALHIVYNSKDCKDAIFRAVSLGGDADTVACIVGQIAGSIWGLEDNVVKLYQEHVSRFDKYKCARMANLLFNKMSKNN